MADIKLIKTKDDYEKILKRIDEIFEAEPGSPAGDELELLTKLVEIYEEEKYPIDLPSPVAAIKFRMEQQGLKSKDLIPFIGSKSKVSEVLSGKRALSLNMIRKLHEGLGIPAEVLIQESGKELPDSSIMEHGINFPFTEMYKRGWFKTFFDGTLAQAKELKEELIIKFVGNFNIQDVALCYNRKSENKESENLDDILMAWRIRVMNLAAAEKLPKWDKDVLTEQFFSHLAMLSVFDQGPKLAKELLNKVGIHFIIEEHLEKSHLDGSSMLMPDGSPLIALTLRYDRLDSFWFTLFHELAHVKKHLSKNNTAYFDDITNEMSKTIEKEADTYAKEMLIPMNIWKTSGLTISSTPIAIRNFAEEQHISPAIPAGRLRFENKKYTVFNNLIGNGVVRKMFNN